MQQDWKQDDRQVTNELMQKLTSYNLRYFKQVERYHYPMSENYLDAFTALAKSVMPTFRLDRHNHFLFQNLLKWVHGDSTMAADGVSGITLVKGELQKGLFISGNTGTGKTMALELLRVYSAIQGFKVKFPACPQASRQESNLRWLTVTADEIVADFLDTHSIQKYKHYQMLCIEDLGREQVEAVAMGNRMNVLKSILEYRGDQPCQLTLVTSNYTLDNPELIERYGDRVVSRLYGMCNYFELGGPDRRRNV